jgi:hypothetical protein
MAANDTTNVVWQEAAEVGDHFVPVTSVSIIATLVAATVAATGGAQTAAAPFHLVFDGQHTPALTHAGTFTTSVPYCTSGTAADISTDPNTQSALRKFTCGDSAGDFTARVSPLPSEHRGSGSWQIVEGSGPLANLRGKGTWTSVRLSGTSDDPFSITFRSTWDGFADFDVAPPTIAVTSSSARKLLRPKGLYLLRIAITLSDTGGNPVAYTLQVIDPGKAISLLMKSGKTAGAVVVVVRVRPAIRTRILRLKIDATDPVGNHAALVGALRLR